MALNVAVVFFLMVGDIKMRTVLLIISLGISVATSAWAASVPNTFQSGDPALASEVNANFDALVQAVNTLEARTGQLETELAAAQTTISQFDSDLTAAESTIVQLNSDLTTAESKIIQLESDLAITNTDLDAAVVRISELEGNSVLALDTFLFLDIDAQGRGVARFDGINVQITNGAGATNTINGLGNLVVGYDAPRDLGDVVCSDGQFSTQADCEANDEIWARNHKSGSHNIVGGDANSYSSFGGLLVGTQNVINRGVASVSGGVFNIASAFYSSVSGGYANAASGFYSSVSGGDFNTASGESSSVGGGFENTASGVWSSVSGGAFNDAIGDQSSVSGGGSNTAKGDRSSVSGGELNDASGSWSSVSGGRANTASVESSSVSGGELNIASGQKSSVSGGNENIARGVQSSVTGGRNNIASGDRSSVTGGESNIASGQASSISGGFNREIIDIHDWRAGSLLEDQ